MRNSFTARQVLLISDDAAMTSVVKQVVAAFADTTSASGTPAQVLDELKTGAWDAALCCVSGELGASLDMLLRINAAEALTGIVMIARKPTVDETVRAMRSGATSVLELIDI